MVRSARSKPVELVEDWPDGVAADPTAEVARALALRLREVMDGRSGREVGELTGVDYTTVYAILNGTAWPDLMTLARLEAGLDADLWPVGVARTQAKASPAE